jgi:hypothetical protein
MTGKDEMIRQLQEHLKEVKDPMVKRAIEEKIKEVSQDNTIQK